MVIEHLMEAIEGMIEVPEEEDAESESETETPEPEDNGVPPVGDPMKNEINYPVAKAHDEEDKEEVYKSENEDEDKWDNEMQKCWSGYTQVGMKEKNGRMVPNCVPSSSVKKSIFSDKLDPFDLVKRKFTAEQRRRMAEEGHAMPDGSYPIANAEDLRNAIQSVGRAKNYAAAKAHIIRRAKALGMLNMLPSEWNAGTQKSILADAFDPTFFLK